MAKIIRRKFKKTAYKNYQGSDYRVGRLKQGVSLYQLRNTPENLLQYAFSKARYGIQTYSLNQLKTRGASQEDIVRYYERERQLYTGEYETIRSKQFVDNYMLALEKVNATEETKQRVLEFFENKTNKEIRYISNLLRDINVHYGEKKLADKQGKVYDVDSQVIENIDFIKSI